MTAKKKTSNKEENPYFEVSVPDGFATLFIPISVMLSAVIISCSIIWLGFRLTKDYTKTTADIETTDDGTEADVEGAAEVPTATVDEVGTLETFSENAEEICKEDGKPLVILFSTTWCPHCTWIGPTFDDWAKENSDKIAAYHWQLDTGDNDLTGDVETEVPDEHNKLYEKFNPRGSIPTFVFGCKYSRIGNGFESQDDLGAEKAAFDKVIEALLD